MLYFPFNLRRTSGFIGAIVGCFSFKTYQFAAAFGTMGDKLHFFTDKHTAGILIDTGYFGDDFTAFFHIHHVAYMQVQPLDNICIVQGGTFHNGAGQLYGGQIGNRSDCAGTSYLVGNPIQACQCTFCLEFVCDGPPGGLGCESQILLLSQAVDF